MHQKRSAFSFGANGPRGSQALQYAQRDVEHLQKALSNPITCGFDRVESTIADDAHVVLAQLEEFVRACERLDLLVVHFSGHGFRWRGQLYLLCNHTDVEKELFNATAINILQIKNILDGCKAKHKLLILDCCYAGSAWKGEGQIPELEMLKGSVNSTIAACPPHTLTQELDSLELYGKKGASFLSWAIACACDEQFTQVAQEHTLSLNDILGWVTRQRDMVNQTLQETQIPAPRTINERDLVGDDEIWFTLRRRASREEARQKEKQLEEHMLLQEMPYLQRPCPTAKLEHFDTERVKALAQKDQDVDALPMRDFASLCQYLGLTSTRETPINAAVLVFHRSPARYIPAAMIRATGYIANERNRYFKEDIEGPLGKQIERALYWVLDNLRTISEHKDFGQRVDRYEIPEQALRELIANAIVHRNYEARESVQIKITPREVIITNPGQLRPEIVGQEQPFTYHESHPYNPVLMRMLGAERWTEGRARGFQVVTEEFQRYNLPLPQIKNLPGGLVQVIIQRPEMQEMISDDNEKKPVQEKCPECGSPIRFDGQKWECSRDPFHKIIFSKGETSASMPRHSSPNIQATPLSYPALRSQGESSRLIAPRLNCPFCNYEFRLNEAAVVSTINPGKVLRPSQPGVFGTLFRPKGRLDGPTFTSEVACYQCPHCLLALPQYYESSTNIYIGVVGDTSSGKTHYLASLLSLMEEGRMAETAVSQVRFAPQTEYTVRALREYRQVFEHLQPFEITRPIQPQKDELLLWEPLIFRMLIRHSSSVHESRSINLIFYDVSGEDIAVEKRLERYGWPILRAHAFIYLADPLSMKRVVDLLPTNKKPGTDLLSIYAHRSTHEVLDSVIQVVRRYRGLAPDAQLLMPVAMTISKSDLLDEIVHPAERRNMPFLEQAQYDGLVHVQELAQNDTAIRKWLVDIHEIGLLQTLLSLPNSSCFAVSATGSSPNSMGKFESIQPRRCLDPLLWILWRLS